MVKRMLWLLLLVQLFLFASSTRILAETSTAAVPSSSSGASVIDGVYFKENILIYYPPEKDISVYAIPSGTVGIAAGAFRDAIGLDFIIIPSSCKCIGIDMDTLIVAEGYTWSADFGHVKGYCVDSNNQFFSSRDGVLFSKDASILYQYPIDNEAVHYSIPEGVTEIAPYAFYTTTLQSVSFPDSLLSIGKKAFYNSQLRGIDLSLRLQRIESYAFAASSSLVTVSFADEVVFIDVGVFEACNLAEVTLPLSLEHLGRCAFWGNPFAEDSIVILPEALLYIGDDIFGFGNSSWDTWTPIYAVYPQSLGHMWANDHHHRLVLITQSDYLK